MEKKFLYFLLEALRIKGVRATISGSGYNFPETMNREWFDAHVNKDEICYELFEKIFNQARIDFELKMYSFLRAQDYPTIENQLDMIYWDKVNGTHVWQDTIQAIKNKYPKP